MKTKKKVKDDYPFGCNKSDWDAIREDAKNTILANQKGYARIKASTKKN